MKKKHTPTQAQHRSSKPCQHVLVVMRRTHVNIYDAYNMMERSVGLVQPTHLTERGPITCEPFHGPPVSMVVLSGTDEQLVLVESARQNLSR